MHFGTEGVKREVIRRSSYRRHRRITLPQSLTLSSGSADRHRRGAVQLESRVFVARSATGDWLDGWVMGRLGAFRPCLGTLEHLWDVGLSGQNLRPETHPCGR